MKDCLIQNERTKTCLVDNETVDYIFQIKLLNDMYKNKSYLSTLKEYLNFEAFGIYKCYQQKPYSGNIILDECKIVCQISSIFVSHVEYYNPDDCGVMKMVM